MILTSIFSTAIFKSLLIVLAVIMLDTVLGILISMKKPSTFNVSTLPQFIKTNVFPYIGGLVVLALLSVYLAELSYVYYAAVGFVTLKFSKEALLDKVKELFS